MTRDEALDRISRPELPEDFLKQEFEYVAKKLDLTTPELEQIFRSPNKSYRDYKNRLGLITLGTRVMQSLGIEKRRFK